ncbi:MAG: hypothetical protein IJH84_10980 [Saccharopolyspora sp.]|uniref:hypothetical protein n=1 Tax=unclassified Saccharopolyspora TaxID=2646250 RepID=UPI0025D8F167|nr:hypothetical protein [Saccharopolyspora sp.]MBQ6641540.1 hypothetical protein [Saccharopolyspora sp.]
MQRYQAPEQLADRRATEDVMAEWTLVQRKLRTCFHCSQVYLGPEDATRCEKFHEGADSR